MSSYFIGSEEEGCETGKFYYWVVPPPEDPSEDDSVPEQFEEIAELEYYKGVCGEQQERLSKLGKEYREIKRDMRSIVFDAKGSWIIKGVYKTRFVTEDSITDAAWYGSIKPEGD